MSTPLKPWENTVLQNNANVLRSSSPAIPQTSSAPRSVPALPPRPTQNSYGLNNYGSSLSPYSGLGGFGYGSYSSSPYRSSLYSSPYNSYGSYGGYGAIGGYGGYGSYGNFGNRDIAEERFIQFAEERSRSTFSNVENIVRAFSSISMMLDNTFFAMTSSFRAVLSVAENFGRLRTVFGQIWYSINLFRLLNWLYRKLRSLLGYKSVQNTKSLAWNEAVSAKGSIDVPAGSGGSNWPTFAFLGVILSAPYFISKLLPKYEDKCDPEKWKSSAIRAKAAFDFIATSPNEMTINTNDEILLAPKYIQEEMKLTNTGWGYAFCNGRTGVVPLNYILVMKRVNRNPNTSVTIKSDNELPIPRPEASKGNGKRVSFGETQFFESAEPVNIRQEEESQEAQVNNDINTSEDITINDSAITDSSKKIDPVNSSNISEA